MNKGATSDKALASWVYGSLLLGLLIGYFAFGPGYLEESKQRLLAVFLALLCGFFTYFLTGELLLRLRLSAFRVWRVDLRAAGGLAVFAGVLSWLWLHPMLPTEPPYNPDRNGSKPWPPFFGPNEYITLPALIEYHEVPISNEIGGRIVGLKVDSGSKVRRGEVVAQVDAAELEHRVEQARAALTIAKTRWESLFYGPDVRERVMARGQVVRSRDAERQALAALTKLQTCGEPLS
jgi:multidrug efflux pump subunit AcrA (membrane-fusion protein)